MFQKDTSGQSFFLISGTLLAKTISMINILLHCVSTIMDTLRFTATGEYLIDIKENTMDMD